MRYHGNRSTYFIVGHGTLELTPHASGGFNAETVAAPAEPSPGQEVTYKFGWMFGKSGYDYSADERARINLLLSDLGERMSTPVVAPDPHGGIDEDKSDIPAGYTYLGQFIAHEISFDKTNAPLPDSYRSPEVDLDSLYGAGPGNDPKLYNAADPAKLEIHNTLANPIGFDRELPYDLPRDKATGRALIGDPRNDENLAVAQTHVAFIKFHNNVVDELRRRGHAPDEVFEAARRMVVQHFQSIILYDYLPQLVEPDVLNCVVKHGLRQFSFNGSGGLFMPLEFSAAALRIGHSMVRDSYQWNKYHFSKPPRRPALLSDLFRQTAFSGKLARQPACDKRVESDWIIDWRRFYDFTGYSQYPAVQPGQLNMSRKLDTIFQLDLKTLRLDPDSPLAQLLGGQRVMTIRNLLRGFALGLPTGEEVARGLGESPLSAEDLAGSPHGALPQEFHERTPLWYYILREAEMRGGNRLGPVGGRIVAATLVEIIRQSRHSILRDPAWQPGLESKSEHFKMTDLLHFAGVVDPIGKLQGYLNPAWS